MSDFYFPVLCSQVQRKFNIVNIRLDQVNSGCETIKVAKVNASNEKMKMLKYQRGTENSQ